jgi:hypothetical protein
MVIEYLNHVRAVSAPGAQSWSRIPFAHPKGFDFDSGFGLINAAAAVGAVDRDD